MENARNSLGGGAATPDEEMAQSGRVDAAVAHIQQLAETQPSTPLRLDEADLLRFMLLSERARRAELQHAMHQDATKRTELELNHIAKEGLAHMQHIEQKYGVDMRLHMVTEDGTLAPRSSEPGKKA